MDPVRKAARPRYHCGEFEIQITFLLFVVVEAFVTLVYVGKRFDRVCPQQCWVSGIFVFAAWAIGFWGNSLWWFYGAGILGGIGAGLIFAAVYGNAVKWFPERRGRVTGLTAAAYNSLPAVLVGLSIRSIGYEWTFLVFAIAQGAVIV
jgi:OFA family oxalate/formate antiporter-like MFS transporter